MANRKTTKKKGKKAGEKVGRKPVKIDPEKVARLAAQGLNKAQVAAVIGLGESQWYVREKQNPEIAEAYKRGGAKGVLAISNALFEQARSGNTTAQIFFLKCRGGWRENTRLEITGADGGPIKNETTDAKDRVLAKLALQAERIAKDEDNK